MPTSFRELATYMDPIYPPKRLRGVPISDDLGWLSIGADENGDEYEYNAHNESIIRQRVEDAGLAHEEEKGLSQVHRFQPRQRRRGDDRSFRRLAERHANGTTHKFLFYNTWLLNVPIDYWDKPLLESRRHEIGRALDNDGYDIVGLCEVFDESERDAIRGEFTHPIETRMGADQSLQESSGLFTIVAKPRDIITTKRYEYSDQGKAWEVDYHATKGVLYTEIDLEPGSSTRMCLDLYTTHTHAENEESRRNQVGELVQFVKDTTNPRNVTVITGDMNVDFRHDEYGDMLETVSRIDVPVIERNGLPVNLNRYVEDHRAELAARMLEDAGIDAEDALDDLLDGDFDGALDELGDAFDELFGGTSSVLPFDPLKASPEKIADYFGWTVRTHRVEFDDLWLVRGGRAGATHEVQNYDSVCALDDEHSPDGYHYCQDYDVPEFHSSPSSDTLPGYRLDYLFLQAPTDEHSYNLDCTRIRRRPFWRSEDDEVGYLDPTVFEHSDDGDRIPHFMSDHIALDVEFVVSPPRMRTRRFE